MKKRTKAFISLLLVAIFTLINHTQARVGYLISQDNEGVLQQTSKISTNDLPPNLNGLPVRQEAEPWQATPDQLVLRSVGDILIHDRVSWLADIESPIYLSSSH